MQVYFVWSSFKYQEWKSVQTGRLYQVRIIDSYAEFPQKGQLGYVKFKGTVPVVSRHLL